MTYTILYDPAVYKELAEVPATYRNRILDLINLLENDPRPAKSKQLRDPQEHLYRVGLGRWRVVYSIDDDFQEVLIVRVGEKTGPEFYEDLPEL